MNSISASIVVAGDLCASGQIGDALSSPGANSQWSDLRGIGKTGDFSIVNVECPLTDHPGRILKSGPRLWGPAKSAMGIRAAGFTAACLANNHILDAGPAGLLGTIRACGAAGLMSVGAGKDYLSATAPLTTTVRDLRLSVLAFAENEFSTTTGPYPGAWPLDLIDNARQIAEVRESSDFVLVLFHGGAENYPLPSPRLQKACRFFVDQGADAVVCHHSHVIGGHEFYKDRPIVYGTGNLLFASHGEATDSWFTGCIVRLHVACRETLRMELMPYRQDPAIPSITLTAGAEREELLSSIAGLNMIIQDPDRLRESWSAFCLGRRSHLLGSLLCLTKPESWLLDQGLLPTAKLRLTQARLARLRNLFSCESHSESCEQVLRDMLRERDERSL